MPWVIGLDHGSSSEPSSFSRKVIQRCKNGADDKCDGGADYNNLGEAGCLKPEFQFHGLASYRGPCVPQYTGPARSLFVQLSSVTALVRLTQPAHHDFLAS